MIRDLLRLASGALVAYPTRTGLMMLAMAIGVAAVIVLTALGEAAHRYVIGQFSALGTDLLIVFPGRSETTGTFPGALTGAVPRELTLEDALALTRARSVAKVAPLTIGSALLSWQRKSREVPVLGTTSAFAEVRKFSIAQGTFLPARDPRKAEPIVVLGDTLRDEIFAAERAVGQWIRLGDRRFRVIGVLAPQGQALGFNTDEIALIPVSSAQQLFNQSSLLRIMVEARGPDEVARAKRAIGDILKARHEGENDVTVVTQDALLGTFDRILRALTLAVGGIAAISLAVAGVLIMNVMLIAISQRTAEIGLLKAIGATPRQIGFLFFTEAALLSLVGATAGVALGISGSYAIGEAYPALELIAPAWAIAAALATALTTGIVFSIAPVRRAARLDPIQALYRR